MITILLSDWIICRACWQGSYIWLKIMVLWAETFHWATNFYPYSPNIRLWKDNSVTKNFHKSASKRSCEYGLILSIYSLINKCSSPWFLYSIYLLSNVLTISFGSVFGKKTHYVFFDIAYRLFHRLRNMAS